MGCVCVQDVFKVGERVRCLIMGMDDNFTRISLSTAELEESEGDIMFDKVCLIVMLDVLMPLYTIPCCICRLSC